METERSAEALTDFLRAVRQTPDPYQSTRVAKALRRVAVRDLDRKMSTILSSCQESLYNVSRPSETQGRAFKMSRLHVLGSALVNLRPDSRSICLQGCIALIDGDFRRAGELLTPGIRGRSSDPLQPWLRLNRAAAADASRDFVNALSDYDQCAMASQSTPSIAAAIFGLLVSLRVDSRQQSEIRLRRLFDSDSRMLTSELNQIGRMYRSRTRATGRDPMRSLRPALRGLGNRGAYIESELASAV